MVAALTFQIVIDARESGFDGSSLIMYIIYVVPLALVVALILTIPMALIWIVIYSVLGQIIPQIRQRATVASGVCSVLGLTMLGWFFATGSGETGRIIAAFIPAALLPIFLAVSLTWRAFTDEAIEK